MDFYKEHEFSRTEMLLGSEGLHRMEASTIAVFGIGGVGSHAAEALARSGVGCLILVDSDTVSLTNINRQSIALHSTIGRNKTLVMKEKIADINPQCRVICIQDFILPENLGSFFASVFRQVSSISYIVDAIDTVSTKLAIAEYAFQREIPLISSMGTGNKLHPELFEIADIYQTSVCPLCRVMRKELKKIGIPGLEVLYSREEPLKPAPSQEALSSSKRSIPGSVSFVPPVAGLLIAGHVIRKLCGI